MKKQSIILGISIISIITLSACQSTPDQISITPEEVITTGSITTGTTITGDVQSDDPIVSTGSTTTESSTITISKPEINNDTSTNSDLIYRNEEYGFEIKLPPEWKGYKVYEAPNEYDDRITTNIFFTLPVTEERRHNTYNEAPTLYNIPKRYSDLFVITVIDANIYETIQERGMGSREHLVERTLGNNQKYYFVYGFSNMDQEDFYNLFRITDPGKFLEGIITGFRTF